MYINHDDLAAMATGGAGVLMLKAMDRERDALQRQVSTYLNKTNAFFLIIIIILFIIIYLLFLSSFSIYSFLCLNLLVYNKYEM